MIYLRNGTPSVQYRLTQLDCTTVEVECTAQPMDFATMECCCKEATTRSHLLVIEANHFFNGNLDLLTGNCGVDGECRS
ncbi:unnamed protein product [Heligmosomoides polygyrus]|uniref:Phlebovirus glycoprotein G2 fusion domain-containing protein n=1 Tax=Heligmosomoides polygyrus TaxID=6339 RepID=A0A183FT22_HELPZ|nr:unnamed protein product [Heligmosomoides polygyrus]